MVSPINSVNQYPVNKELLEVTRRLQSLGLAPSGNLTVDRQRLQTAELQKRQQTLASNSEVNLSRLEGTKNDFSSTIQFLNETNRLNDQEKGLISISTNQQNLSVDSQYKMTGAVQIAELNKLRLGLTA